MKRIGWGIVGTGGIAGRFAIGLSALPEARIAAVGSRDPARAESFGRRFEIPHRHADYAALAGDPEVDAVYVATPNTRHKADIELFLDAGKAVLCEKPFTINAGEAAEMIALSRGKKVFLMEAMCMRLNPAMDKVRELLAAGAIGEPRLLKMDFGYRAPFDPKSRLFDPGLGGGAALDLGVYPLSLGQMIFGKASKVTSTSVLGKTGVDEQSAVLLAYEGGKAAMLSCSLRAPLPEEAVIIGTNGEIRIHPPLNLPIRITLTEFSEPGEAAHRPPVDAPSPLLRRIKSSIRNRPTTQRLLSKYWDAYHRMAGKDRSRDFCFPVSRGNGYKYEAAEVTSCLRAGKPESSAMPLDDTLAVMETLDQIRRQCGLRYPDE